MAGFKGQLRTPREDARSRRNADGMASSVPFIDPANGIALTGDGTLALVTADGVIVDAGELVAVVAPPLELSGGAITLSIGDGLAESGGDLVAAVAAPLVLAGGAIALSTGDGLAEAGGDLEADLGDGLTIIGGAIAVNPGNGIAAGATVAIDLAADPGLAFDSGALHALVDPNGGIQRVAAGLRLPLTSLGELLAHDGTQPVVVPPGTDGQVLKAASGQASGLEWADESAGAGALDRSNSEQQSGFQDRQGNDVFEVTVPFGALPDSTSKSVSHGVNLNPQALVEAEVWASNGSTTRPVPWTDGTDALALEVDVNEVTITSNFDATSFTDCDVFLRYTKGGNVSFVEASDVTYGAGDSVTSISQTVPASSQSGDMIVAVLMQRAGADDITPPSMNWTRQVQQAVDGSETTTDHRAEVWIVEDDGTLGGTSVTFTGDEAGRMSLVLLVLRASQGSVTVEDTAGDDYTATGASPGIETVPPATSSGGGRLLLGAVTCAFSDSADSTSYEFPGGEGWTQHTPTSQPESPSHERNRLCVATRSVNGGATPATDVEHGPHSTHDAAMLAVVFAATTP